ncbi:MAG TPA: DUF29 domain-containing protein [Azospirillum sp.]
MGYGAKYEDDFYAWTQEQASRLREAAQTRVNLPLDWENLAEEIESMGRSDLNGLISHLERLIEHLLKLEISPAANPRNGWKRSVVQQRLSIARLLKNSPSLKAKLPDALDDAWQGGRQLAALGLVEDDVTARDVPADCPYTADQLLDPDWWPANWHGLD